MGGSSSKNSGAVADAGPSLESEVTRSAIDAGIQGYLAFLAGRLAEEIIESTLLESFPKPKAKDPSRGRSSKSPQFVDEAREKTRSRHSRFSEPATGGGPAGYEDEPPPGGCGCCVIS